MPTVVDVKPLARGLRRRGPGPAPRFRFPCGHVEGQRAVSRRLRTTERAAWISCRRCNLITLVVAREGKSL